MEKCLFCRIAKGDKPEPRIWASKEFFAVLDAFPNTEGAALIVTKEHYPSQIFGLNDGIYKRLMLAAKKVSILLKKGLKVKRIALVAEGMGVDHAHIKLYPMHGLKNKYPDAKKVFFKKYPGYLTTRQGPKINSKQIDELARTLRK